MEEPDLIAAFEEVFDTLHKATPPRHPGPGCPCIPCRRRDDWLESLAEQRADERNYP